MQAGKLRHVVDIQVPTEALDTYGQEDTAFTVLHSQVRAEIVPLSGREYIAARQVAADITTRITIRHYPGVTPKCRVVRVTEDTPPITEVYDITAVLPDPKSGRQYLTLMCMQRTAEGFRRGD
jgi:SPP1 family predicted phage head-tail adaptor